MHKRIIYCLVSLIIATLGISTMGLSANAAEQEISVYLDGSRLAFDVSLVIVNGRVMVPIRVIAEAMGAGITWEPPGWGRTSFGQVSVDLGRTETYVFLNVNDPLMSYGSHDDGTAITGGGIRRDITLDAPPMLVNGRVLVPLRAVSEGLGAKVVWDGDAHKVSIASPLSSAAYTAATGANDFAFKLSASLAKQSGKDNLVCSPYSVWLPLAALTNATDKPYKDQLLATLEANGLRAEDINRAASRMLYDLTRQQEKGFYKENGMSYPDPLKIANGIFVNKNLTLNKDFAQIFKDFYQGDCLNIDFSSKGAVDTVNRWASENTNGLITDLVDKFDPETVAAVVNAIYFSDRWQWEFDEADTATKPFHAADGDVDAHFMLRQGDNQVYYEDEKLQAMPLRLKTGGGMYILLPKDGDAAELLESMTSEYLDKIQANSTPFASGKLLLPRFDIESGTMDLKEILTAMGIPLFDQATAPLVGLTEEKMPVWLSGALQKAMIHVDEKGTTAAAVTVMGAAGAGIPPEPTKYFNMVCDKPFVFVLFAPTCDGGNQVLFTGMVNRP